MFKRITALLLCLCLCVSLTPAVSAARREPIRESVDQCCHTRRVDALDPNYVRPAYDGKLIDITPQRVADTFDYLDELYVQQHPEAALVVNTGTDEDRAVLKTLAETITAGCTTDQEKADAIGDWLSRNIDYEVNSSAYASDTFCHRVGNCLSYANLMQFLLRSLGIPAVVGDGWRGDMKTSTVDLFNYEGHAWCFVRLDGQWVLYDPLWLDGGTTDRDYMAEWMYFDTVEFVTPASDGDNLPPEAYDKPKAYYTDGRIYVWSECFPEGSGNLTNFVNNQAYNFTTNQCESDTGISDGWYYLDGVSDKTQMQRGEVYRNSWISYGDYHAGRSMSLTYAHANGMQIDGAVMEFDGSDYFMYSNQCLKILCDERDYDIHYGMFTLKPGYSGPFLDLPWQEGTRTGCTITWESRNPEVATVEDGVITCHADGCAEFAAFMTRDEDGALMGSTILQVLVSDEERIPNYSDRHDHVYKAVSVVAPTCTEAGYTVYQCIYCTDRYRDNETDPLGHDFEGTVCTRCGATRLTPFDDVAEGAFYETCVAWAVENRITKGMSDTTFVPDGACTRGQVVTFLWRACGSPEPTITDHPFTDVNEKAFYYRAMLWAVETGITTGMSDTTFEPNRVCDRGTVVTFLHRAQGKPAPTAADHPFTDVEEDRFYYRAMLWAVENKITSGMTPTTFAPKTTCTRGQVVTFLYRACAE